MGDSSDNADTFWYDELWYDAVSLNNSANCGFIQGGLVRFCSVDLYWEWIVFTKKEESNSFCLIYLMGILIDAASALYQVKKIKIGDIWGKMSTLKQTMQKIIYNLFFMRPKLELRNITKKVYISL